MPLVDHVTSARDGKKVLVSVVAAPLVFFVPDDVVVDRVGNVYSVALVNNQILSTLKSITVTKKTDINEHEFKTFVQTVPAFIKEQYDILWKSPHEIYLKPVQGGATHIIRYDKIPTAQQLAFGQQLIEQNKNKKKEERVVDFRFSDQIVLGLANRTR